MSQGYSLGVDLYELWRAGKVCLKQEVAPQFSTANRRLNVARSDGGWFRSCDVGIGGIYGAGDAFGDAAATLNGYLKQTRDNLVSTGDALIYAANNYAGADQAAVAEFERRKRELPN